MDSSEDSEMSSESLQWRLRSRKRVHQDHQDTKNKVKARNESMRVMCNGAKVNSTSCVCALTRANDVQVNLSKQFPSCVKLVTTLLVPGGKEQYLNLPKKFCKKHLPIEDGTYIFVDENEKEYSIGYRFRTCRFRIGWRTFSNGNGLLMGDALVFHLIGHCKFKVYIVRSCRPTKVDGAIQNPKKDVFTRTGMPIHLIYFLLNHWKLNVKESHHDLLVQIIVKENGDQIAEGARNCMRVKEEKEDLFWDDSDQEDIQERLKSDHTPSPSRDKIGSDVFGSIRFSASVLKFQDVKRFEDFKICVDGLILDSEFPVDAKRTYYKLCCSQKMFLHGRMTLSSKLVSGMISETSNIADAIQSTTLAASLHNLESWDNTLKAFEDLGMNVGFLRTRIDVLAKISRKYQTINETNSAKSAQVEEKRIALNEKVSTMDALQKSITALEELINSLEAEINDEEEGMRFEFCKIASAPW